MKNNDLAKKFCENVRELRKELGLSKSEMAKRLHLTLKTLNILRAGFYLKNYL